MARILAWPLKRVILSHINGIVTGQTVPPPGTEPLVWTRERPVEVAHFEPPEPDRICVYGTPLRGTVREVTAEYTGLGTEGPAVELRVRIHEPGEDVIGVDTQLGQVLDAVVSAVLDQPLLPGGRLWLAAYAQNPPALTPTPSPAVTITAGLVFRAEVVGHA
jgi:hypothetical protein